MVQLQYYVVLCQCSHDDCTEMENSRFILRTYRNMLTVDAHSTLKQFSYGLIPGVCASPMG